MLAHTYDASNGTSPLKMAISGHAFSPDGIEWSYGDVQPYSSVVQRADGSVELGWPTDLVYKINNTTSLKNKYNRGFL